ncbi:MAG TPA: response regulator, partial [Chryseolinea sp.]
MRIAKNGEEGLALLDQADHPLSSGKPDLILLDMNMPRMNGIEFLQILRGREEWKHIKVFVLTTSDESEDEKIMRSLGISGYIIKPLKVSNSGSIDAFNLMIDLMNM